MFVGWLLFCWCVLCYDCVVSLGLVGLFLLRAGFGVGLLDLFELFICCLFAGFVFVVV